MFVIDFFHVFFFSVLFLLASLFILFSWFFTFGQVKSNTGYGRSRHQSFRLCKINLPTLKVTEHAKTNTNLNMVEMAKGWCCCEMEGTLQRHMERLFQVPWVYGLNRRPN